MNICFLDGNKNPYTSRDLETTKIRGAENVVINLSRELYKLGHRVTIFNNVGQNFDIDGIKWKNLSNINKEFLFDLAISNNDLNLFHQIKSKQYLAISHSIQSIEKFIRKKQFFSYLKYKPKFILLSNYHDKNRNKLLKIFGSIKLEWAVDEIFLNATIEDDIVENKAIFTSRNDRNLDILINIWKEKIYSQNKNSKLYVTPSLLINNNFNIFERNFGSKNLLIDDLKKSKVLLIPGHKGEIFCIAAEEARELCVPIVTLGIGSLSERVNHGQTGFIAKNENEFANYALEILNDNSVWQELRNNLKKIRGIKNWPNVTQKLINSIK